MFLKSKSGRQGTSELSLYVLPYQPAALLAEVEVVGRLTQALNILVFTLGFDVLTFTAEASKLHLLYFRGHSSLLVGGLLDMLAVEAVRLLATLLLHSLAVARMQDKLVNDNCGFFR